MVTCQRCGKLLTKDCNCFSVIEWCKEYSRLGNNELTVIESVRKKNKPLFIQAESTGIKKQAKITKLEHYGITAQATFRGNELGNTSNFNLRLLDENDNLIYWRNFEEPMSENDSFIFKWKLGTKSKLDKIVIKFLKIFFKGKGQPKTNFLIVL